MRTVLERLSAQRCASFLAVLKRFEHDSRAMLGFPIVGLDARARHPRAGAALAPLLDGLDELVVEAGGRVYLTKDSRLRAELVPGDVPAARSLARGAVGARSRSTRCAATWIAGSTSPARHGSIRERREAAGEADGRGRTGGRPRCRRTARRRR